MVMNHELERKDAAVCSSYKFSGGSLSAALLVSVPISPSATAAATGPDR